MNCVLEHEVDKVRIRLHKLIELLKVAQLSSLLFVEYIKIVLTCIKFHVLALSGEI